MPQLEEVYTRLQINKKRKRELAKMIKDDLRNYPRYEAIQDEMKRLREEKKAIEDEVKAGSINEANELDELKTDIQSDQELLADIALNMYVNSQEVEIVDEFDQKWYPEFKVAFKKS